MSGYLPIVVKLSDRRCVVVGGGEVAARRVETLLESGAQVTVVAPVLCPTIQFLAHQQAVTHVARAYETGNLESAFLVIAATDRPDVNVRVIADAQAAGILCCDAKMAERGDFVVPAVLRRGDLIMAVTTMGSSPSLAARIRRELEHTYGAEYAELAAILRDAREAALRSISDAAHRRSILGELASDESLLQLIREGRAAEARAKALACISS